MAAYKRGHIWSRFDVRQPLLYLLVQPEELLQLLASHSLIPHLLLQLLLLLVSIPLVTKVVPAPVVPVSLIKQILCIMDVSIVVFLLFLFLFLLALGGGRLWQFNVIFDHLIGKNNALVWASNPRGFRLYLNRWHTKLLQNLLLESRCYVWFLDMWKAEE